MRTPRRRRARSAKPISTAAYWRCGSTRRTRRCACSGWRRATARKTSTNGSPQCGAQGTGRGALNEPGSLCRQHLEHVAVRVSEIKTASATTVIDLHVVEGAGSAAISNALGADAIEDAVKLRLIDLEGVVMTLELRVIVEIEGQRVVDPQRREVRERTFITQTQDAGEEARRCFLVMRRDDRMVEHNGHRHLLRGDPVIASEIGGCVADVKARRARRLPSSRIADEAQW